MRNDELFEKKLMIPSEIKNPPFGGLTLYSKTMAKVPEG